MSSRPASAPSSDGTLDQQRLLGLVGYNCRRAYLHILSVFLERTASMRLRPVDYSVLAVLRDNRDVTQKQLALALDISPPNLAVLLDRATSRPVVMASTEGGVDIEEVAAKTPEKIIRESVDPSIGLMPYQARKIAVALGLKGDLIAQGAKLLAGVYKTWWESDASLVEINPLCIIRGNDGKPTLSAVDAKMSIDDNALYRHPDIQAMRDLAEEAFLAGVGAVALTKERADELASELAQKGKLTQDDARELVDDVMGRWRGDALRLGERAGSTLSGVFRELGLVTRREHEELELRLAQLEHRLRLVEGAPQPPPPPPGPGP